MPDEPPEVDPLELVLGSDASSDDTLRDVVLDQDAETSTALDELWERVFTHNGAESSETIWDHFDDEAFGPHAAEILLAGVLDEDHREAAVDLLFAGLEDGRYEALAVETVYAGLVDDDHRDAA